MPDAFDKKTEGRLVRSDIACIVARSSGLSKNKASEVLDLILDTISDATRAGKPVRLKRFGTFVLHKSPPRVGRNPRTGESVDIPTRYSMKFRGAAELRDVHAGTEE